ncbi:MAG: ORF6N domain-containing protein [Bacteroidales bacterium]|nr:ORF6N domain-containing protein [Bacteroidales bacterium]
MLDFDLAEQYGVENKYLKRAVRNNIKRFEGEDFMFELTREELSRCKNCTLNKGRGSNIKYLPFAFTELGVAMLSGVLNSDTAIDANRRIMRAFVAIRQYLMTYAELKHELYDFMQQTNTRLDKTDAQLDSSNMKVDEVFKMLKEIFEQKNAFENRQRIGFNAHRE